MLFHVIDNDNNTSSNNKKKGALSILTSNYIKVMKPILRHFLLRTQRIVMTALKPKRRVGIIHYLVSYAVPRDTMDAIQSDPRSHARRLLA